MRDIWRNKFINNNRLLRDRYDDILSNISRKE